MSTKTARYLKYQKSLDKLLATANDEPKIDFTNQKASNFVESDILEPTKFNSGVDFKGETKTKFDAQGNEVSMNVEDFMDTEDFVKGASSTGTDTSGDGLAGMDMSGMGNAVGAIGSTTASIVNLGITLASKEDETKNPFAGFATEALGKIGDIKSMAGRMKDLEMSDIALAEQGQRSRNRNMARGISDARGLDLGTHIAGLGARKDVVKDYTKNIMDADVAEMGLLIDKDKTIMGAEERRMERDQTNKDNYLSNLSSNIMDFGNISQQIGRNMNISKENEIGTKLAGSGEYGTSDEYLDYFKINYPSKRKQ